MGITPAPSAPNHLTLDHLLKPVIGEVADFGGAPGVKLPTFLNPEEVFVRARIGPVLADSPARALISGFLSHSATYFCAFCLCRKVEKERTDLENWTLRNGAEVKIQAAIWESTKPLSKRTEMESNNGVRWTELHRLDYWDPVKHVVLGFMHNWLEGVLEHHLRVLWGIGRNKAHQKKANEINEAEDWVEEDLMASEEENTYEPSVSSAASFHSAASIPPSTQISRTPSVSSIESRQTESGSSQASMDSQSIPPGSSASASTIRQRAESDVDDEGYINVPEAAQGVYTLPEDKLLQIRECIRDITLPTWIGRPPTNLGEASHGKLKANDYWVLFSCILPLVVPELWSLETEADRLPLEAFHNLVAATNIICSFKTSNAEADAFTYLYVRYRRILQEIFPYWPSKPNHHFAMHVAAFLRYWGPLPPLSEFSGERLIGIMQNILTNMKIRECSSIKAS